MTLIRAALAALLLAACTKGTESRAGSSESPPPSQPATEPAAAGGNEGGSARPEAPKVAIGADRVELIGLASKTLAYTESYTVSVCVPLII